jgi:hypothetical protein
MGGTGVKLVVVVVLAALLAAVLGLPAASAEALSPWWGVTSGSEPTNLESGEPGEPGEPGEIVVTAENRGDAGTSGEVTISDELPAGLHATAIKGVARGPGSGPVECSLKSLTCTYGTAETTNSKGEEVPESLPPYQEIEVEIFVSVGAAAASGERNTATVSGGGAASSVSASHAIEVDGSEKFGVEDFQLIAENAGGSVDTRAGSHPFQLTSVVTLNTTTPEPSGGPRLVALPKAIVSELPAGLLANPAALARCTKTQFYEAGGCPAQSAVGVATVTFNEPGTVGLHTNTSPIFNVTPSPGEPVRFGVKVASVPAFLETSIRSGSDYGVTLASDAISQAASVLSLELTFWGVPGDPRHDAQRGLACLQGSGACAPSTATNPPPFLSLGTSCGEELQGAVVGDAWAQTEPRLLQPLASYAMPALTGCSLLPFEAGIDVSSDTANASGPAGLNVDLHVPQSTELDSEDPAESAVKDIALALPAGVALNAAGADGLQACSESQVGFTGFQALHPESEPGAQTATFTGKLPEPLEPGPNLGALGFCTNASKIATVEISTPLLANPLRGSVYLAAPQNFTFSGAAGGNPFRSLVAVYVVAEESESGVLLELPGKMSLNQQTGQITATFENTPQLPFEDIDLQFFGGPLAPLSSPARCGSYTTSAWFVPAAAEGWDEAAMTVHASSTFDITNGPNGGAGTSGSPSPCPGATLPFSPSLTAGTTNLQAGGFSPLTVTLGREDGQQAIQAVQLKLPPGLSGILAGVPLCPEAQATAGTCGPASEIGETTLGAGLGPDPYTLAGGRVYLTGPYNGTGPCTPGDLPSSSCAPFGLSIAVPARVGPFTLREGRPIVVRAKLEIDPATAALTITTGSIPNMIEGFPLQIQHLNITIGRSGFIFNPTSCARQSITGTITGDEGTSAPVSSSFEAANCAALKFTPKLAVSTSGKTSQADGASLAVKLSFPNDRSSGIGQQGAQANIRAVKIDLPKQLPSRLTTLQQACLETTFQANPATCPPTSVIGHVTVSTPILPGTVPGAGAGVLSGPAYFVSHGGESFPDLELVLQGGGVKIDLVGSTFISKKSVTSVTFKTLPDVPVSSFQLTLPEGPFSALGTNKNLCKLAGKLAMPTALTGQNGAQVHETTKVGVIGWPPARPRARKKTASRKQRHAKKR